MEGEHVAYFIRKCVSIRQWIDHTGLHQFALIRRDMLKKFNWTNAALQYKLLYQYSPKLDMNKLGTYSLHQCNDMGSSHQANPISIDPSIIKKGSTCVEYTIPIGSYIQRPYHTCTEWQCGIWSNTECNTLHVLVPTLSLLILNSREPHSLTLKVPVTAIDALRHFETG